MLVYRICGARNSALDGEGSRLYGGRWNAPGRPAVYTSTHLSLAALEYLVHVDFDNLPVDLVWLKIEVPDAASIETFPGLKAPNERDAEAFGDDWLASERSLCLNVPSAVLSVERNVILNPIHSEMPNVSTLETNVFEFDDRLFKR
ncbi:MAG: RES domain-containing protein [Candidatus Melainabacteria bacterium]|nr:MAG: RES domain-containing protein [Candidatus Melainabacteria bacterium]